MRKNLIAALCGGLCVGLALASSPARADADEPDAPGEPDAPAAPPDSSPTLQAHVTVRHVPPAEAIEGRALRLVAVVDQAWGANGVLVRYRAARQGGEFHEVAFERSSGGGYYATIPAADVRRPGVEYTIVAQHRDGSVVAHFATAEWPHEVRVEPDAGARWIEVERRRLDGRDSGFALQAAFVNFGTTYGDDYFMRGEASWTHRVVTGLYSFKLGYGAIEGLTPEDRMPRAPTLDTGFRYGFGEARFRAGSRLWLDLGALLGFSHDGFAAGVRAQALIGRDDRTCVVLGGETIGGLGGSTWVRLQWDTVVPFLMSAELRKTDLPASPLEGGQTLSYTIDYPLSLGVRLGANVSFSSRDRRPGGFGGGLSAALDF